MTMPALAAAATTPNLNVIHGGARRATWWERRAMMRSIVGGCRDHWWNPTAKRTAACTCDRYERHATGAASRPAYVPGDEAA